MPSLNLQIDRHETTRRHTRRVVWHLVRLFGSAVIGAILALLIIHHDWTGPYQYQGMDTGIYLERSAGTLEQIQMHYQQPLLQGSSYSLAEGLSWSRYGIMQHLKDGEVIAVTIDRSVDDEIKAIFTLNGYFIHEARGNTTISTYFIEEDEEKRAHRWRFNLFNHGRLYDFAAQTSLRLRLTDTYLQLRGLNRAKPITSPFHAEHHIAAWSFDTLPAIFEPFSRISAQTIDLVAHYDAFGLAFRLKFHESDIDPETLAQIGKEYLLQNNLSTTAWTIRDGTQYLELRHNGDIQSDITHIEGITQINLSQDDHILRMTRTEEVLIISNRTISLTTEENTAISTCLPRAKQLLSIQEIVENSLFVRGYIQENQSILSPIHYSSMERRGALLRICR